MMLNKGYKLKGIDATAISEDVINYSFCYFFRHVCHGRHNRIIDLVTWMWKLFLQI